MMTDRLADRLTPVPQVISMAPDLLAEGTYSIDDVLPDLLASGHVESVDVVSFRTDFDTLDRLKILHPRASTRVLLVPPGGITRQDVDKLHSFRVTASGLSVRQIDRTRVGELIHYKLMVIRWRNGRRFAMLGSANLTRCGTKNSSNANAEVAIFIEVTRPLEPTIVPLFETLWENGSKELTPSDFAAEELTEYGFSKELPQFLPFQHDVFEHLCSAYPPASDDQRGVLVSLPTGAGKTFIAVRFLLEKVLVRDDSRVLWVAPHLELLCQAASSFERCRPYARLQSLSPNNS